MPFRTIFCKLKDKPKKVYLYQIERGRIGSRTKMKSVVDFDCEEKDQCAHINECDAWRTDY